RAVGAAYVPPFGYNPPMLAGGHSEPFDIVLSMSGLGSFEKEYKSASAIRVGGLSLKVLPLERILVSKTAANRPKDQMVLPVLQNVLRTLQAKNATKGKRAGRGKKRRGPS